MGLKNVLGSVAGSGGGGGFMKFLGGGGAGLIGAGISLIGGLIGAGRARREARRRRREAAALNRRIENLEANRQKVINPYANVKDLSSMVSNPFENLQVATEAAEMKAREQDLSLATTLDTLRATGAGAGGATALAQAASRSKANIAASIEQQEAQNTRLRAQGEQQMQQLQMREAARVQTAEAQGKAFMFSAQEKREMQKLNRLAALQQNAAGQAAQLRGQASTMTGQALGSVGNILGAMAGTSAYNQYLGRNLTNPLNSQGNIQGTDMDLTTLGKMTSQAFNISDRRLKQDIEFLRLSPSGLKIYSFKYKNQEGVYEGVMSDEIPAYAIVKNFKGIYDGVDYSKIDVKFKRIK